MLAGEYGVERVNWLEAQRQALLAIVAAKKNSDQGGISASILPTNPDFDPILFLTLVRRNATYQDLQDSTSRLSWKTDNQVERLQNIVRDNFALFIKCSEGIDVFSDRSDPRNKRHGSTSNDLQNRFGTLDGIAQKILAQA